MINFKEIIENKNLITRLAEAFEYGEVSEGECLMIHKNSGDFSKVSEEKIEARKYQGWIECVCADTLETLVGLGETSDDGIKEAEIVANWMREQK